MSHSEPFGSIFRALGSQREQEESLNQEVKANFDDFGVNIERRISPIIKETKELELKVSGIF